MDKKVLSPGNIIVVKEEFCGFITQRTYRILDKTYKYNPKFIQVEWYSSSLIGQIHQKTMGFKVDDALIRKSFLSELFNFQMSHIGYLLQKDKLDNYYSRPFKSTTWKNII